MDRMCLNIAVCVQQPARKGNDDHGSGTESENRRVHRGKQGAAAAGHCRAGGHRQRGGHPGRGRTLRQAPVPRWTRRWSWQPAWALPPATARTTWATQSWPVPTPKSIWPPSAMWTWCRWATAGRPTPSRCASRTAGCWAAASRTTRPYGGHLVRPQVPQGAGL